MTSRSHLLRIAVVTGTLFLATNAWTPALAQQPEARPVPPPALPTIPVKVDVTLARYQGEKKVSSLPFSLYASAGPSMPPGIITSVNNKSIRSDPCRTRNAAAPFAAGNAR